MKYEVYEKNYTLISPREAEGACGWSVVIVNYILIEGLPEFINTLHRNRTSTITIDTNKVTVVKTNKDKTDCHICINSIYM